MLVLRVESFLPAKNHAPDPALLVHDLSCNCCPVLQPITSVKSSKKIALRPEAETALHACRKYMTVPSKRAANMSRVCGPRKSGDEILADI